VRVPVRSITGESLSLEQFARLSHRERTARVDAVLAGTVAITAVWSVVLLGRSADWYPWLRLVILVTGLGGAVLLLVARQLPRAVARAVVCTVLGVVSLLWVVVSSRRAALHDLLVGSTVVYDWST